MSATVACLELERRLSVGWDRIALAEAAGEDIAKLEAFWLGLLRQYEATFVREDDISRQSEGENAMPVELTCRQCGAPFVPTKADLVKGPLHYRTCPSCRLSETPSTCEGCGRPLHNTSRRLCLNCLTGVAA